MTPHNFLASSLAPTPLHSSHSGLYWFPKFILLSCLCICCSSCPCPLSVQGSSTCLWGLNPNVTSVPSTAFLFSPPRWSYSQSGSLAVVFQELLLCTKSNFVTFSTLCCNWWLPVFFLAICESRHPASFFPVAGTPQGSSVGMRWVREECFPWKCQLPSSLCLEMIKSMASPKELPCSLPIPKYSPAPAHTHTRGIPGLLHITCPGRTQHSFFIHYILYRKYYFMQKSLNLGLFFTSASIGAEYSLVMTD